jgi:hypothetical protein
MLYSRGEFENYAVKYMAAGDTRIAQQPTGRRTVSSNFVVDDAIVSDFREHLKSDRIRIDEDAFQKDLTFIKAMIRFRVDEAVFGVAEAKRHLISVDPQAQLALASFAEAEKLNGLGKGATRAAN